MGYVAGGAAECQGLHEVSLGDRCADRRGRGKGVSLTRLRKLRKALE
jgi:hypothetical protein